MASALVQRPGQQHGHDRDNGGNCEPRKGGHGLRLIGCQRSPDGAWEDSEPPSGAGTEKRAVCAERKAQRRRTPNRDCPRFGPAEIINAETSGCFVAHA